MVSTVKPNTKPFSSTNGPPGRKELPTTKQNGIKIGLAHETIGKADGGGTHGEGGR